MNTLLLLWGLTGGGIATLIMMRLHWLPRPLPIMRYVSIFIAGIVGGIAGGHLVDISISNPMPGIVAASAGGLILSGGVMLFGTRNAQS